MTQYCYVVVVTDGNECWTRLLAKSNETTEGRAWDEDTLEKLLLNGWRPVRETPMSAAEGYAFSLVLLERG